MSIQPARIQALNSKDIRKGDYVLYWMQQSQRAEYNHALEFAIQQANDMNQMLLVAFGIMADYPEANRRHYTFMLEGLKETQASLASRGIKMILRRGHPIKVALSLGRGASVIVCDRGYLRHQRDWRRQVALKAQCSVIQVESDVVVPVEAVSNKAEYAARTIRPKIKRHLETYLIELKQTKPVKPSLGLRIKGIELDNSEGLLNALLPDSGVTPVTNFFKGVPPRP